MFDAELWKIQIITQTVPKRVKIEKLLAPLKAKFKARLGDMDDFIKEENNDVAAFDSKKKPLDLLLGRLNKQQRAEIETDYWQQLQQIETFFVRLAEEALFSEKIINTFKNKMSDNKLVFTNDSSLASQPSSSATEPPTKEMLTDKENVELLADIASCMTKLQALLVDKENKYVERKQAEEKTKIALDKVMAEVELWKMEIIMQTEPNRAQIVAGLQAQFMARVEEMQGLIKQDYDDHSEIVTRKCRVKLLLENLEKKQRAEMEAHYSHQLQQLETSCARFESEFLSSNKIIDAFKNVMLNNISELKNVSNSKLPQASQPSSSKIPQAVDLGKDIDVEPRAVDLGEKEVVRETQDSMPVNSHLEGTGGTSTKRKKSKSGDLIRVYSKSCKMLNNTIIAMNTNLSKMVQVQDGIDLMRRVQREINNLSGITFEEAFEATNIIGKCPLNAEMFFGYDLENKVRMVQMVARKSTS